MQDLSQDLCIQHPVTSLSVDDTDSGKLARTLSFMDNFFCSFGTIRQAILPDLSLFHI